MVKIIKTLGALYLSFILFHTIAAKPAEQAKETEDDGNTTTTNDTMDPIANRPRCQQNTKSCSDGFSCIRFDSDSEDEYSCIPIDLAFCETDDDCKTRLGDDYEFCYLPPWKVSGKKQCFKKHSSGSVCKIDNHCVNNLQCNDNTCISKRVGDLSTDLTEPGEEELNKEDNSILGINRYVFIGAVSFPFVVLFLCMWGWIIGRTSSKAIENQKKEKYEKELKEYSLPGNGSTGPLYVNPQKQLEDEVGIRTFKTLFRRKKPENIQTTNINNTNNKEVTVDISTTKIGGKSPISTTSNTQQKMKKSSSSTNTEEKENNSSDNRTPKKGADGAKTTPKTTAKTTTKNAAKNTTKNTAKSPTPSNAKSPALSSPTGKPRVTKKKAAGGKKKKGASSNDTNTNSTSSKQSSQRGLVNNASNLSSALSGQSASYFGGASPIDPQSALYYQQMYGNQAAAAQNQYYASYLQNPYYAAAAQNAAYYGQDPNLMYGAYPNTTNYQ